MAPENAEHPKDEACRDGTEVPEEDERAKTEKIAEENK